MASSDAEPPQRQKPKLSLEEALLACRGRGTPVSLVTPDLSLATAALVVEVTRGAVTLALHEPPARDLTHSVFLASFPSSQATCAFFSHVLEVEVDELHTKLVLELPEQMLRTESRASFRIPIFKDQPIEAHVSTERGQWSAVAENISLTGIRIHFDKDADPAFEIDEEIEIELRLDDHRVLLKGIVRYRGGSAYGVFFPETMTGQEVTPPAELRKLVMAAQRYWLRNRV